MQNTAGIEGAKMGKWTKGMPPHQGLNPSAPKLKGDDVGAGKEYLSATKKQFPAAKRSTTERN